MTQDNPNNIAEIYTQIVSAEMQATNLERMLNELDSRMDSILKEAEELTEDIQSSKSESIVKERE